MSSPDRTPIREALQWFLENIFRVRYVHAMGEWSFLTNHARALVCIARDPGARLRDIADVLGVTERRAFGIVNDLAEAGYVLKQKDGRRNRYRIQHHLPLRVRVGQEPTIGELLGVIVDTGAAESARTVEYDGGSRRRGRGAAERRPRSTKRR
jgi:DNA-binding transcriptional ArsR family regulator